MESAREAKRACNLDEGHQEESPCLWLRVPLVSKKPWRVMHARQEPRCKLLRGQVLGPEGAAAIQIHQSREEMVRAHPFFAPKIFAGDPPPTRKEATQQMYALNCGI